MVMKLDLEQLEECPTNKIAGFYERLQQLIPSLYSHQCSEGRPGGFFFRVKSGTWMGHVIEHIALEIQSLAGMDAGFGRTRGTGDPGIYNVVFAYQEERAGLYAARSAVAIAEALVEGQEYDLQKDLDELRRLNETDKLGPSTSAIVEACVRKGIPYMRLDGDSYVQLGYGSQQKRIHTTATGQTSMIASDLAGDKSLTKEILTEASIPVPFGEVVESERDLEAILRQVDFPLVVKPLDGNHGRGVTTNIQNASELFSAYMTAKHHSEKVIVERFARGSDYRLLVIDYKFVAAAQRVPARVIGDGKSTITELVELANKDPRRGDGHLNLLTKIDLDQCTLDYLATRNLTVDSVVPEGEECCLKRTVNLSTGGTSIDVTDVVHPEIAFMAERAARAIGLDICGIDLIAEDVTRPLKASGAVVIEVNACPGFRMHTHPSEGKPRDVGNCVAEMLFPKGNTGRIPIIAITGTNGKTTTTRLTAHIARQTGARVGFTTTDGIYIGDYLVEQGDTTGPVSAAKVLKDSSVEFAVLECARGGILRSGLAFDQCDVGIVTNVAADHLGLHGIRTVEDMAKVKAVIPETVKKDGYSVLNADNEYTYAMRERISSKLALFSMNPNSDRIKQHVREGGLAAVYEDGYVTILDGPEKHQVEHVNNIPLTFKGTATFMIENCLASTLAAYCTQVSVNRIAQGLRTFTPSFENTPGRMNLFNFRKFSVLVDYAHNPHGLSALGEYIKQADVTCKIGILTGVGDRRDEDLVELGRVAGGLFDEIVIRLDEDYRGRNPEEIVELVSQGIRMVDPRKNIEFIPEELKALDYAIRNVRPGCMIVHLTEKVSKSVEIIQGFKELDEKYSLQAEVEAKV